MRLFCMMAAAGLSVIGLGPSQAAAADSAARAYDFSFTGIDGAELPLAQYRGRPMLVVNTASRCGFTGQYEGMQTLWDRYRDQGLVVLGAPSNDFRQELRDEGAVKEFCDVNFGITFPMTEIVSVKGSNAHPFYAWAAANTRSPSWNFNKYLIDGDGQVVRHYGASARPERIAADIEAVLASVKN